MINIKGKIINNYGVMAHVGIGSVRYVSGSDLYSAIEQYLIEHPVGAAATITTINEDGAITPQEVAILASVLYYAENDIQYLVTVTNNGVETQRSLNYSGLLFVHKNHHHYLEFGEKLDQPFVSNDNVLCASGIVKVRMAADIWAELEKKLDADRALSNIEIQEILKW